MHNGDVIAALMATSILITTGIGVLRYRVERMRHRERMALIEKGMPVSEPQVAEDPRKYLRRGVLTLFLGISLAAFFLLVSETTSERMNLEDIHWRLQSHRQSKMPEEWVRRLEEEYMQRQRYRLPPQVALVGFVPAAVGVAYLLLFWMDRPRRQAMIPEPGADRTDYSG